MDSFICGTCNLTFHDLEIFAEHKQAHKVQLNDKAIQDGTTREAQSSSNVSLATSTVLSATSHFENLSDFLSSSTKKIQTCSPVTKTKKWTPVDSVNTNEEGDIASPSQSLIWTKSLGLSKKSFSEPRSKKLEYPNDSGTSSFGHIGKNKNSESIISSGSVSNKEKNMIEQLKPNSTDQYSPFTSKDIRRHYNTLSLGSESSIHIFENDDKRFPLGKLILNNDLKGTVCIEISEIPNGKAMETSKNCDLKVVSIQEIDQNCVTDILGTEFKGNCSTSHVLESPRQKNNSKRLSDSFNDTSPSNNVSLDIEAKRDVSMVKEIRNENEIISTCIKGEQKLTQNDHNQLDQKGKQVRENANVNKNIDDQEHDTFLDFEVNSDNMEISEEKCEDALLAKNYTIVSSVSPNVKETRMDVSDLKEIAVAHDNLMLNDNEMTDVQYASEPGLYTLLLNADNTFTLVAGGYQGSTDGQNSRIFVCHHCKKFASSQVEILNHISLCHPDDLQDVNQCVDEFSSLSSTTVTDELASRVSLPSDSVNNERACEIESSTSENHDNHFLGEQNCMRSVKKKLGRPRKEDQAKLNDQTKDSNKIRNFMKDAHGFTCLNCTKLFPKHRQFEKHKCNLWKIHSTDALENSTHSSGEKLGTGDASDDFAEDLRFSFIDQEDLEEEWKANKRSKPKVKNKTRKAGLRKRGRPPKVDIGGVKIKNHEDNLEKRDENSLYGPVNEMTKSSESSLQCGESRAPDICPLTLVENPPPHLNSIPTLPVFSNARQQERLHKWMSQIDLTYVDAIIEKVCPIKAGHSQRGVDMYVCKECKILFRSLLACRRHCAKHMPRKAFTCPDCDFATTNMGALYSHYRIHTQNLYTCHKCNFRARNKAHFRDHLETHSSNRYICRLCQRPYSTYNSLRSHIYLYHSNKEGAKYLWSMRKKNQDQDAKNVFFQCPMCSKLFGDKSAANRHIASHGPSSPDILIKCEVCNVEIFSPDSLSKHMQKHKVVFVCCVCCRPQRSANCLRNHLRKGACGVPQPESFKKSLLVSFTSLETFPSLLSNKKIGSILQDLINDLSRDISLEGCRINNSLLDQMECANYQQISRLLSKSSYEPASDRICDIMKIVVDTRCTNENDQLEQEEFNEYCSKEAIEDPCYQETVIATETHENDYCHQEEIFNVEQNEDHYSRINQQTEDYIGHKINGQTRDHSNGQTRDHRSPNIGGQTRDRHSNKIRENKSVYSPSRDPTCQESDQRVMVISNIGEQHTVVVEDGQMMTMDEERFVVINEDNFGGNQSVSFATFFDNG